MSPEAGRAARLRTGVRLEIITVAWMTAEATVAIVAGILAGSALLTAFGIDSIVELITGSLLLWRLSVEARGGGIERVERAEQRTAWIVTLALVLLCFYVLATSVYGLVETVKPKGSPASIAIALIAAILMPWLWRRKQTTGEQLDSGALRGDAASSLTCGYMSATVLAGLALNAVLGWWWAEYVAALVFLVWLAGEAKEAIEEARE